MQWLMNAMFKPLRMFCGGGGHQRYVGYVSKDEIFRTLDDMIVWHSYPFLKRCVQFLL